MDNLHFIPNNILTNFFKELIKKKKMTTNSVGVQFGSQILTVACLGPKSPTQ